MYVKFASVVLATLCLLSPARAAKAPAVQDQWPVVLSIKPGDTGATPALSITSFATLGATAFSPSQGQGDPNFRFHVTEVELDLGFHLSRWLRFELALHHLDGNSIDLESATALSWMDNAVQKALIGIRLPHGFCLTLGKYFAFQGWESENTYGRNMITASYAYDNTPSTQTGMVLGYSKDLKVLALGLNAFAINNWDSNLHNALYPSGGLHVSLEFRLGSGVGIALNTTVEFGTQPGVVKEAFARDPVLSWNANLQLSFWSGKFFVLGDTMVATRPGSSELSYALMGMLHAMFTRYVGVTARYSRFEDRGMAVDTPSSQNEFALALLLEPLNIAKGPGGLAPLRAMRLALEGRLETTSGFDFSAANFAMRLQIIVPFQAILRPAKKK